MKMFRGLNSKTIAIVAALAIGLLAITATGSILAPMGALAHSPFSGQSSDQRSQGPQGPQEWNHTGDPEDPMKDQLLTPGIATWTNMEWADMEWADMEWADPE